MAKKQNVKDGKRYDLKGRVLKPGEVQDKKTGRYMFSMTDPVTGKRKYIYSWKLERHDPMPAGKY